MKIGYIGNNYLSSFRKVEAYAKCNPHHTHVFYKVKEYDAEVMDDSYHIGYENYSSKLFSEFNINDVDLVISINDRYFRKILEIYNLNINNLTHKNELQIAAEKFIIENNPCFSNPKNTDFNDDDVVIVKPFNSSGTYDPNPIGYKTFTYSDIKDRVPALKAKNYIIQERIQSDEVILLHFISNGDKIYCADIGEQQFIPDGDCRPFLAYTESGFLNKPEYAQLKQDCLNFLITEHYYSVVSHFTIQCVKKDNKYYIIDCNTRVGPSSVEVELLDIASAKFFNYLDFMLKNEEFENVVVSQNPGFVHFASRDSKILTDRFIDTSKKAKRFLSDNKKSGVNRSDIDIYAYAK